MVELNMIKSDMATVLGGKQFLRGKKTGSFKRIIISDYSDIFGVNR